MPFFKCFFWGHIHFVSCCTDTAVLPFLLGVVRIIENLCHAHLKMNRNRFVVYNCVLEVCRLLTLVRREEVGLESGMNSQVPWDEKLEQDSLFGLLKTNEALFVYLFQSYKLLFGHTICLTLAYEFVLFPGCFYSTNCLSHLNYLSAVWPKGRSGHLFLEPFLHAFSR